MKKYNVRLIPKEDSQIVEAENENEAEEIAVKNYLLEFEDIIIDELPLN